MLALSAEKSNHSDSVTPSKHGKLICDKEHYFEELTVAVLSRQGKFRSSVEPLSCVLHLSQPGFPNAATACDASGRVEEGYRRQQIWTIRKSFRSTWPRS